MSDIFENDIAYEEENLSALEDNESVSEHKENYVFPKNLIKLKLEYSFEGIYASPNGNEFKNGDYVIVPTRYGNDLAKYMGKAESPVGIKPSEIVEVIRPASKEDLEHSEELKNTEISAAKTFREKVELHHLDMKLVAVHFLVGEQKALFFFSSENRVDFRELVKDLVSIFKMRIELRQIGVRDESRIIGGIGVCGRPCCCNSVSDKLKPVSIKMAKEQNLSLNSLKISGLCGRLLCCLSYEYDWYAEERKRMPSEGIKIFYDGTNFRITEVNPISCMVKMMGEDGRLLEVNAKRFVRDGHRWKIN